MIAVCSAPDRNVLRDYRRFRLGVHGRQPVDPRLRFLQLAGEAEQKRIVAVMADELDATRQTVGRSVQRQGHRR
jgi:hypothetical protein